MRRVFGKGKKKAAAGPAKEINLEENLGRIDGKVSNLDQKIRELEVQILDCKKKMQQRGPAARGAKQRALQLLKRKKMYEQQRDQMSAQSFALEQTTFAISTAKDTVMQVDAMKQANTELKQQYKDVDVYEVEDLHDDMEDLMADAEDIQEVLGRSYGMDVDEGDLEAELEGLEDDWAAESDELPAYLQTAPVAPTAQADTSAPVAMPMM
eukprot:TRINITY_DN2602_c0_g2_i1.p2 TRINITY_DN2602_c0_g2~~TRINITY_DN2602_c0_g2_i1.p2  ORF type:complete len:210 (+),score=87.78 TRINITY_DN2602_c0_g2_i1:58-687(+)